MGKRPHLDHVSLTLRVPRGSDGIWSIILDLDKAGPWSSTDVGARSNVASGTICDLIRRLVKSGYARVVSRRASDAVGAKGALYRLSQRPVDCPRIRRDGTNLGESQNEAIWRSIKMAKVFGLAELAELASAGRDPVPARTVQRYVYELHGAGVIGCIDAGGPARPGRYRLLLNLGAKAPKILRAHIVFDPNSGTVIGTPETKEVA